MNSKKQRTMGNWIGISLKVLLILFLLFDSLIKVIKHEKAIEGTVNLGVQEPLVPVVGMILLAFTILYAIPQTSLYGSILLTAYLGSAAACMIVANKDGHPFMFPVVFATLVWVSQVLISPSLKNVLFSFKL